MTDIRLMTPADIDAAMIVAASAFDFDLDAAERERPGARERWRSRTAYLLDTDPEGCFVTTAGGVVTGIAQAMVRDGLWVLSLLTVDPLSQSDGSGRALMDAALAYRGPAGAGPLAGTAAMPGLIVASNDPRALRLYSRAGFELLPVFVAEGDVAAHGLPRRNSAISPVAPERLGDFAALTTAVRGAAYTAELARMVDSGGEVLGLVDRGFVAIGPDHGVWALVADDDATAGELLWAAVSRFAGRRMTVRWLTAEQQWGIDAVLAAGLKLKADGALCVRGRPGRLRPFIPSGPFA